jgi:hypothetical protein
VSHPRLGASGHPTHVLSHKCYDKPSFGGFRCHASAP